MLESPSEKSTNQPKPNKFNLSILTPLQIQNGKIPEYASIPEDRAKEPTKGNLSIGNYDLGFFTFDQWSMYLSRTIIYPFAAVFAASYNMTPSSFSYIMSAFDFGGCIAVVLTLSPTFNKLPIRYCIFVVLIMCSILSVGMSLWTTFAGLFAVRLFTGVFATIGSAQIRGTIGATLKDTSGEVQSRLTCGIMLVESSWSMATFGWMLIGIIINRISVFFAWYIIAGTSLLGAIFAYFLPTFSIFDASPMEARSKAIMSGIMTPIYTPSASYRAVNYHTDTAPSARNMREAFSYKSAYDLYVLYLGMFMNGIPFYCFFSTFGGFMQDTFDLNAEQLGGITLTVTAGEISALVTSSWIAKYKSNMFIVMLGSCLGMIVFCTFVVLLHFQLLSMSSAMGILYLFTYTIELSYLNVIVCTLDFSPPKYEATSSLIGQFVTRSSAILSVIVGVHIVEWIGYEALIESLIVAQMVSIVVFVWLFKLYRNKQAQKQTELIETDTM